MSVIFQKIKEQILTKEEYIKNKDYEKSYSKEKVTSYSRILICDLEVLPE